MINIEDVILLIIVSTIATILGSLFVYWIKKHLSKKDRDRAFEFWVDKNNKLEQLPHNPNELYFFQGILPLKETTYQNLYSKVSLILVLESLAIPFLFNLFFGVVSWFLLIFFLLSIIIPSFLLISGEIYFSKERKEVKDVNFCVLLNLMTQTKTFSAFCNFCILFSVTTSTGILLSSYYSMYGYSYNIYFFISIVVVSWLLSSLFYIVYFTKRYVRGLLAYCSYLSTLLLSIPFTWLMIGYLLILPIGIGNFYVFMIVSIGLIYSFVGIGAVTIVGHINHTPLTFFRLMTKIGFYPPERDDISGKTKKLDILIWILSTPMLLVPIWITINHEMSKKRDAQSKIINLLKKERGVLNLYILRGRLSYKLSETIRQVNILRYENKNIILLKKHINGLIDVYIIHKEWGHDSITHLINTGYEEIHFPTGIESQVLKFYMQYNGLMGRYSFISEGDPIGWAKRIFSIYSIYHSHSVVSSLSKNDFWNFSVNLYEKLLILPIYIEPKHE